MNYAHNRTEATDQVVAICEVCEEDCSMSEAEGNQREWGLAICDSCVEGGLQCGALPIGGEGTRMLTASEANIMFDVIEETRLDR